MKVNMMFDGVICQSQRFKMKDNASLLLRMGDTVSCGSVDVCSSRRSLGGRNSKGYALTVDEVLKNR